MNYLKTRISMYEILVSVFYPPSEERAADIIDGRLAQRIDQTVRQCCEISAQCCLPPDLLEEIQELTLACEEEKERVAFFESLETEYVRLFVNDFPTLRAPPYESFYQEGRMMGKAAVDSLSIYEEDGLTLQKDGELPDHIVSQLEYLLFLCLGEKKAEEEQDAVLSGRFRQRKRSFYERHIMNWVPEFCSRVRTESSVPYYRVMARLLKNFLALENRNLTQEKLVTVRGGNAQ